MADNTTPLGDFLNGIDNRINQTIGGIFPAYNDWMANNKVINEQINAQSDYSNQNVLGRFLTDASRPDSLLGAFGTAFQNSVGKVPGVQFVLDLPNRSIDTLAIVGQSADRSSHYGGGWGELLNGDTWNKAWNSWGQEGHASAGTIWGNMIRHDFGGDSAIDEGLRYADPFDAQSAKALQAAAKDTWYGVLMGGSIDLAAGFINPVPGLSAVKATKAARAVDAGHVEGMAELANSGKSLDSLQATKVRDVVTTRAGGRVGPESLLAQMRDAVDKTADMTDQNQMMNYLAPWMQNSSEAAKATMADLFVEANKLGPDMGRHVKVNAILAAMGSPLARAELVKATPSIAAQMENVTRAPGALAVLQDLTVARTAGGSVDYNINNILDSHFNIGGRKAELDAARAELEAAMADTAAARKAMDEINAAKPAGRNVRWHEDKRAWAAEANAGKSNLADSLASEKWKTAELDLAKRNLADARARAAAARPGIDPLNNLLTKVMDLGSDGNVMTGTAAPSRLDALKTAYREQVGAEWLYGQQAPGKPRIFLQRLPSPQAALAQIGTHRARGGITLAQPDLARQELMESMKRSGVYTADEIRAAGNDIISTAQEHRGAYVERIQKDMLTKVAAKHGKSLEQALDDVSVGLRGYDQGRQYLTRAVGEADAKGSNIVLLRMPDGEIVAHNKAVLKSHIQDTAPFADPVVFDKALKALDNGAYSRAYGMGQKAIQANQLAQQMWKHAVLLRPGLGVRAMLDTELRSIAMLNAATAFADAINGVSKMGRKGLARGAARLGIDTGGLDGVATQAMGFDEFMVDIGGGKKAGFTAYSDRADFAAHRVAASKGSSTADALIGHTRREFDRLQVDRAKWEMYKAGSLRWDVAYNEHAMVLLNSPTAKALLRAKAEVGGDLANVSFSKHVEDLFSNPAITAEYNKLALPQGIDKMDYVATVMHEVDAMFPTVDIANDMLNAGVGKNRAARKQWIEKNFPPGQRFDIPGPESIMRPDNLQTMVSNAVQRFYQTILDQPDFWMARHPVFVHNFQGSVKAESASLLAERIAKHGPDAMLTRSDLAMIDARARTAAMTRVRNTFFDTTRYTGAHHYLSQVAPFFAPWEDAMVSWSRLMYDDPRRIFRMGGAWNAAGNLNQWLPEPIFIDGNGQALRPGQDSESGKYIVLPIKVNGTNDLRINQEALNSIAQGEVAWLPGFGPTAQVAVTTLLGNAVPRDVVLDLVGTDNWLGKNLLKSMYLDGELPRAGVDAQIQSVLPSTLRNIYNDIWGNNYAANVSYYVNNAYIESQRNGTPFDQDKVLADATKAARTAAIIRSISQGGLGMSGRATVEGQFYVDEMHYINSLTPDQIKANGYNSAEEMFTAMHPDASRLDWRLTRNETGINATVNAEKSAYANSKIIDKYPEMGWFIVGSDNVGGDFSRTAYNMQSETRYGLSQKGRVRETPEQTVRGAIVSQGWDQYMKFRADLGEYELAHPITTAQRAMVKAAFVQWLAGRNREWYVEYNDRKNKLDQFWSDAKAISANPKFADREDMKAFAAYSQIRQQVLDGIGAKNLNGTGAKAAQARAYLRAIGEKMASRNLGFEQAWNRVLSSEVDPFDTDSKYLGSGNG